MTFDVHDAPAWKRLFHRWFIEYNPLYLLSAALVLRGVNLLSNVLVTHGRAYAELGGPAIAELYAWTLIGCAALLLRVGLRRPAVILSMLVVVYQGDLTLHTETCAYIGGVGWIASIGWLASFALKLVALARAMRVRISRSALGVATFGAAGLVAVPHIIVHESGHVGSIVAGTFAFALFTLASCTSRRIEPATALDTWAQTVMRRAVTTTWVAWATLAALHVLFWFSTRHMEPAALLPVPLFLLARFIHRDGRAVALAASTLVFVALVAPAFFAFAAALGATAFAVRALRGASDRALLAPRVVALVSFAYLAVWFSGWSGGVLPAHALALDSAFAATLVLAIWQLRAHVAMIPLGAALGHHAIQARVVTAPVTALEWGLWSVGVGFVLLVATVVASIALHFRAMRDPPRY